MKDNIIIKEEEKRNDISIMMRITKQKIQMMKLQMT